MIEIGAFKSAMRCFPTGVTIITTFVDGEPHGFTANSFTSVSLDPPSVLICVHRNARTHKLIASSQRFCVNILRVDQQPIAEHFSSGSDEKFTDIAYVREGEGAPRIEGSLAWLDCDVSEMHSVATHTIFVGVVNASYSDPNGSPLGYLHGRFTTLHSPPKISS
jgi:3-hydroxy-9,10-secoandrosta-1,3,5(10)-triene-9,17-dione monooxygenase reductase component